MNRRFYLIDRENGNAKRRITLREIADHFNGDGGGPVRWTPANVDLDRFRDEMDEIGYTFVVEGGPSSKPASTTAELRSLERRLRTAEKKFKLLVENRPRENTSDRACRRYMNGLWEHLRKVDSLRIAVAAARWNIEHGPRP